MSADCAPLIPAAPPSPWIPERDLARLKVIGKLGEEAGELATIACRCIIQGLDEAEPVTGKPNRLALEEEIADVIANARHAIQFLGLDEVAIEDRADRKLAYIVAWRGMIPAPDWRPIATAPKGEDVLVYWPRMVIGPNDEVTDEVAPGPGHISVSRNDLGGWEPDNVVEANGGLFDDDFEYGGPTYWAPLPGLPPHPAEVADHG